MRSIKLILAACTFASIGATQAHHSFAMFNLSEHRLIEGRVTAWNYNSPHSWLHIEAEDAQGEKTTWSFEGAAPVHATRQGVNGGTYRKGEQVRVVMSPIRDGRNAGAMCFVVKEDGTTTQPNDGTCNAVQTIESWTSNGWIESTPHLGTHPAPSRE
jgi:hypothetical protein